MNKNEAADRMKLNIQLFADTAENNSGEEDITPVNIDNAGDDELEFTDGTPNAGNPPVDDKKITTKAFSERLNREKETLKKQSEIEKQAELDRIAVSRGFKNWKELTDSDRKEKLEKIGIEDPDTFNSLVNDAVENNPIVLEAKKVIEAQKEREQKAALDAAISEISEIDPDIKSVNDLIALENYDEFYALVSKGYSLPDAYKIFAFDKLTSKKAISAAQNVINNINNKGHITPVKGGQTKEIVVPDDVLASYRKNLPNMTEDEIRKHYAKFVGGDK
jgi:hypothetical protein